MSSASPSIVLHHLVNSRSERLFWALEALGLPYTVQVHHRTAGSRAPPTYAGTGKAPAVELDKQTLSESGYILTRLSRLARSQSSTSTAAEAELETSDSSEYYSHFAEGTFMLWSQASTLVWVSTRNTSMMGLTEGGDGDKAIKTYADFMCDRFTEPETQKHLDQLEEHLQTNDWFSGSDKPGIGDFMLLYPLVNMMDENRPRAPWQRKTNYKFGEHLKGWFKRVQSNPAYQRGLERQRKEEASAASKL